MVNRAFVLRCPNSRIRTFFPMFITMLLGMVNMLNVSETIKTLVGVAFLIALLLLPCTESIKYLMFILCANELLNIGTTSLTMIFVALFTVKECALSIRKPKVNTSIFFAGVALILIGMLAYITVGTTEALVCTIKHIFFLYYTAKVLEKSRDTWNKIYTEAFQYMAFGVIYFTILSVVINGAPSLATRFTPSSEITINFFGIVCTLVVVNLLYSVLMLKARASKNIYLIIGCVISGLLTQSRSFILAVVIGVLLLFLFTSSLNKKIVFLFAGILSAFIFVVVYVSIPAFADMIEVVMSRIIDPSNGDISNGRYDLWSLTISAMRKNPVYFWIGAGDYNKIGAFFDNKIMVAHNMFLETWVIYGAIGSFLILLNYALFFKQHLFNIKRGKIKKVTLVPLIVMLCSLFFSHHFIGRSMSIVFAFSFLPIVMNSSNENGEHS